MEPSELMNREEATDMVLPNPPTVAVPGVLTTRRS
jgi:hypothetical protein